MTEDATQQEGPGPAWTQRAGFSVLFDLAADPAAQEVWRTRIYHDETGQEAVLAGPDALRWPRWILARLAAERKPDGDDARCPSPSDAAAVVQEVAVEVVEVRLLDRTAEAPDIERARVVVDVRVRGLAALEQRLGTAVIEGGLRRGAP
jgi:hypothetical protein